MRVIAGSLGGRTFQSPHSHRTHPMSEKVRGALFNMLGDLSGLTVFDAFGGSGALAFEALSRGARHATVIEVDKHAHAIIQENAHQLGLDTALKAIRANASSWSDNNPGMRFGVVLLDPPYDAPQLTTITKLLNHVSPDGVAVLSLPPHIDFSAPDTFELLAHAPHSDAQLYVFRRISS
jgi:16S rRNA (guanine966-N2)-methyltransferase